MNPSPDATDRIRKSITEEFKRTRMVRLRQLEADGRALQLRAAELTRLLKEHAGRVRAMIDEVRQADETTVKLPLLPP